MRIFAYYVKITYRVILVVSELGWVDLDLRCSLGWWAAKVAAYCPRGSGFMVVVNLRFCCKSTNLL